MRRLAAAALLALVLGVGTASADTFAVVPDTPDNFVVVPDGPVALPSSEIPNEPGSILLPPGVWEAPFLPSRELSYEELQALWARAGAAYGIPWQVLAAINKIESNFGRNMGPSSADAVGWMQFIPDTWLRWGTDGDGDGIVDPCTPRTPSPRPRAISPPRADAQDISRAVFSYNHAQWYVNEVLGFGIALRRRPVDVVFTLDKLAVRLDQAQTAVAETSKALNDAESAAADLQSRLTALDERAGLAGQLLSDRLEAGEGGVRGRPGERGSGRRGGTAPGRADDRRSAPSKRHSSGAHAASFPPGGSRHPGPARAALTATSSRSAAVPPSSSVAHTHHDYPAADIAAPEGSPVYALADAIVLEAVDDDRCGIGIMLQTPRRNPLGLLPPLPT